MEEPEKVEKGVGETTGEREGKQEIQDNNAVSLLCPVPAREGEEGKNEGGKEGVCSSQTGSAKKRHRRGSKKNKMRKPRYKWKPYHKLTWEEKRKVEERDSIRATKRREEITKRGRPIAPYNTTQFLMEEHDRIEPDLHTPHDHHNRLPSEELSDGQEDCNGSFSSEDEAYFDQDFTEVYETAHVENLNSMSKAELIKGYLELEKRVETLEHTATKTQPSFIENREIRILNNDYVSSPCRVEILQDEDEASMCHDNRLPLAAADSSGK